MPYAWLNGRLEDEESASISIRDGGLLHGAGVFTTLRADAGRVFRLSQHLERVRQSCRHLALPIELDESLLAEAAGELLERNDLSDARLRLTVTRGSPQLEGELQPTLLLTATQFEPYPAPLYERGMTAAVVDRQKANPFDIQAGHKTLDYLSRFAALRDAQQRGAQEALWFNIGNHLQSGSISNVFLVKDGTLLTPPTNQELAADAELRARVPYPASNVLPGITRAAVLELAGEAAIDAKLAPLTINDLLAADEIFLTNSAMRLMPLCQIERKAIGDGKPGATTRNLIGRFEQLVARER